LRIINFINTCSLSGNNAFTIAIIMYYGIQTYQPQCALHLFVLIKAYCKLEESFMHLGGTDDGAGHVGLSHVSISLEKHVS